MTEELGVGLDEDISTVEAAEKSDDSAESSVNLLLTGALQAFLQLDITELSDVRGSVGALVHELHEG